MDVWRNSDDVKTLAELTVLQNNRPICTTCDKDNKLLGL